MAVGNRGDGEQMRVGLLKVRSVAESRCSGGGSIWEDQEKGPLQIWKQDGFLLAFPSGCLSPATGGTYSASQDGKLSEGPLSPPPLSCLLPLTLSLSPFCCFSQNLVLFVVSDCFNFD